MKFSVKNYDLSATLSSGQAFRWRNVDGAWEGVVAGRWLRLRQIGDAIEAETASPLEDWDWLHHYLQLHIDLDSVLSTFPIDQPMRESLAACAGLRLLRQEPWECLASFICSSTKQIVQIQEIVSLLAQRFGEPIPVPAGFAPAHAFPSYARLAKVSEADLRACKLGFRAPYLLQTAQKLAAGKVDLRRVQDSSLADARAQLLELPGVGPKIADCALLFGFGFQEAFPVDVWIMRALRELYFPKKRVKLPRLRHFSQTYFGPHSGYAQQYLFHYMRRKGRPRPARAKKGGSRGLRAKTT